MANATDVQVQNTADREFRPFANSIVTLYNQAVQYKAGIDDVYNALNQQSPTWTDTRTDGPPHLLAPSDVLGWNAFMTDFIAFAEGHGQWPVIRKAIGW